MNLVGMFHRCGKGGFIRSIVHSLVQRHRDKMTARSLHVDRLHILISRPQQSIHIASSYKPHNQVLVEKPALLSLRCFRPTITSTTTTTRFVLALWVSYALASLSMSQVYTLTTNDVLQQTLAMKARTKVINQNKPSCETKALWTIEKAIKKDRKTIPSSKILYPFNARKRRRKVKLVTIPKSSWIVPNTSLSKPQFPSIKSFSSE